MQKHFCLVEDVSLEKAARKVIKDAKHAHLVSSTLHYT
jgi:hypothetical protein